jgi:hypothetical protein
LRQVTLNRTLLLACTALSIASAQPATQWKFEVASVKAGTTSPNRRPSFPQFLPGGRFTVSGLPLRFLIAAAWDVGFGARVAASRMRCTPNIDLFELETGGWQESQAPRKTKIPAEAILCWSKGVQSFDVAIASIRATAPAKTRIAGRRMMTSARS